MRRISAIAKALGSTFGALFVLAWLLFWTAITLFLDVAVVRDISAQAVMASGCRSTFGVIIAAPPGNADSQRQARPIHYRYSVAGVDYTGDRFTVSEFSAAGRDERLAREFPVGKTVTVYYLAEDAGRSALSARIEGLSVFSAVFLLPFNAVMIVGWVWIVQSLRRGRQSTMERFLIADDGAVATLRLAAPTPHSAAVGAGMLTSLLALLAAGFATGGDPGYGASIVVLFAISTAAMLAWRYASAAIAAGRYDLTVDRRARTIRLPNTKDQWGGASVAFADITRVGVFEHGDESVTYGVELGIPSLATGHSIRVVKSLTGAEANVLAEWLQREAGRHAVTPFGAVG